MKFIIAFLLFIGSFTVLNAQEDSLRHQIQANYSGSINKTSEGVSYLLNNTINYGYKQDRMIINARAGMVFGQSLGNVTNRDFQLGSDINVYWSESKQFYAWGLGNAIQSYSLKVNHQVQLGAGLAWNLIDEEHLYLNVSDGLLFEESEIISGEGEVINYGTIRNSLRVSFKYVWKDLITFKTTNFWQPSLNIANDNIINSNSEIQFKIWKWIHINSSMQFNKISRTNKENLIFTYGIVFKHRF